MTTEDNGDNLTLKQRKWLKVYLKCGNATEAAMRSYQCKNRDSGAQIGWENLRKLDFSEVMEESGITDKKLVDVLSEGLVAIKIKTSLTEPDREVADYQTRYKYLDIALKLKRRMAEKVEVSVEEVKPLFTDEQIERIIRKRDNSDQDGKNQITT